jgi:NADH-quinone oxidoreductase subunit M
MKKLIAYSSVSHLGYCMLGLFALNATGVQGSVLQMVNHGLSTGALFAMVGMLYERYHTRQIADLSGLAARMPWLAFFMVLFTFSSIGVPGLNGFAGEFLILLGAFQRAWLGSPPLWTVQLVTIAVLSVSGVVLGAWYMLWLVQRVFFGPLKEPAVHGHATEGHDEHEGIADLSLREILALAPLAVFVVWIGIRPGDFLNKMQPTLDAARAPAVAVLEKKTSEKPTVLVPRVLPGNAQPRGSASLPPSESRSAVQRGRTLADVRSQGGPWERAGVDPGNQRSK